jgi:hypothetical protein
MTADPTPILEKGGFSGELQTMLIRLTGTGA